MANLSGKRNKRGLLGESSKDSEMATRAEISRRDLFKDVFKFSFAFLVSNVFVRAGWAFSGARLRRKRANEVGLFGAYKNSDGELGLNNFTHQTTIAKQSSYYNWVTLSSRSTTCAIDADKKLWCYGNNNYGAVDPYKSILIPSPMEFGQGYTWIDCSVCDGHFYAIRFDGSLWVVGGVSGSPKFGRGSTASVSTPVRVGALTNWSKVFAGNTASFAVKTDGTLWSTGYNSYGQLGVGDQTVRSSWVQVGSDTDWAYISCEHGTSVFGIKLNGTLWQWGEFTIMDYPYSGISVSTPVQIGSETNWKKILRVHTGLINRSSVITALKTDGTIWTWGTGLGGSLGLGATTAVSTPVQIGSATNWTDISSNSDTIMAVNSGNELWAWGRYAGTFETGVASVNRSSPVRIFSGMSWNSLFRGGGLSGGKLWGYGENQSTLPSDLTFYSSPVQVSSENWYKVVTSDRTPTGVAGFGHAIGLSTGGRLFMWGSNNNSMAALFTPIVHYSSPTQIGSDNWKSISVGGLRSSSAGAMKSFVAGIKENGTWWSWGMNDSGCLGHGDLFVRVAPRQVGVRTDWKKVTAGGAFTIALRNDNTLWYTGNGLLGGSISTPVQIGSDADWKDMVAGMYTNTTSADFAMLLKNDNTLWAIGTQNVSGQLGIGTVTGTSTPMQVGTDQWKKVAAGLRYVLAVRIDGTLWGWGANTTGFLGLGDLVSRSTPVQIGSGTNWVDVSASQNWSFGMTENGQVYQWGGALGSSPTLATSWGGGWSTLFSSESSFFGIRKP